MTRADMTETMKKVADAAAMLRGDLGDALFLANNPDNTMAERALVVMLSELLESARQIESRITMIF